MIKSYIVDETCNDMRLDRWIRNTLGNIPQSLIEKNLRAGKIKVNNKKVKSSFKIKTGFEIQTFNLDFKENILQKKLNTSQQTK
jgi:23S rRNA pseudouridine955/2504/2580 synthase